MSDSRVMWISAITPGNIATGSDISKTVDVIRVWQEIGQSDAACLKACEAVGVAVENTVNMVQVPTGRTEIKKQENITSLYWIKVHSKKFKFSEFMLDDKNTTYLSSNHFYFKNRIFVF